MKAVRFAFALLVVCSSGFAQPKVGAKLPDRVAAVLGVKSAVLLGTPEYDSALLRHFQSLGGMKEVFGYICARAGSDDLIVRAEWFAQSLHVWFGAYEDGDRVECDVDMTFARTEKLTEVATWIGRERAAVQPEAIRAFVSRVEPPPQSPQKKKPNQPSEPTPMSVTPPAAQEPRQP